MTREQMIDEAVRRIVPAKYLRHYLRYPEEIDEYVGDSIRDEFRRIAQEQAA